LQILQIQCFDIVGLASGSNCGKNWWIKQKIVSCWFCSREDRSDGSSSSSSSSKTYLAVAEYQ